MCSGGSEEGCLFNFEVAQSIIFAGRGELYALRMRIRYRTSRGAEIHAAATIL